MVSKIQWNKIQWPDDKCSKSICRKKYRYRSKRLRDSLDAPKRRRSPWIEEDGIAEEGWKWVLEDEGDFAREAGGKNISLGQGVSKGPDLQVRSLPSNATLRHMPRARTACVHMKACTWMSMTALITAAQRRNNPNVSWLTNGYAKCSGISSQWNILPPQKRHTPQRGWTL